MTIESNYHYSLIVSQCYDITRLLRLKGWGWISFCLLLPVMLTRDMQQVMIMNKMAMMAKTMKMMRAAWPSFTKRTISSTYPEYESEW